MVCFPGEGHKKVTNCFCRGDTITGKPIVFIVAHKVKNLNWLQEKPVGYLESHMTVELNRRLANINGQGLSSGPPSNIL